MATSTSALADSQAPLDALVVGAARAAGANVLERTTVEELLYDRGAIAGALVRDSHGRRYPLRARLTVGADGLRSVVARRLGRRTHGRPRRGALVGPPGGGEGIGGSPRKRL